LDPFLATAIFVFGLVLGSFLNVCIYRLPRGLSVVRPRSACPDCQTLIRWYDNIPVLSWLVLRGRCRNCAVRIPARYPVVELLTAVLFLACYAQFGFTLETLKYWTFAFLLTGLIFSDAETQLLPDRLTIPGIFLGFLFSFLVPLYDFVSHLLPRVMPSLAALPWGERMFSFGDSVFGAAVGASFIYGVGVIYLRARGVEGMGFGDVKLMGMVGAFLGLRLTLFTLFAASLAGSIFGLSLMLAVWAKRRHRYAKRQATHAASRAWRSARLVYRFFPLPFGVFLGAMALLAVFLGDAALRWYWEHFL
jgi:leader peptidase (prepilin peptidase)/N-methyltransferase